MNNANLYTFIGKCLVMDDDPAVREEVSYMITGGNIPWEEFVWTGSSHFVLPALFTAFERNGLLCLLPPDLIRHLRHIHTLNLRRNERILEQCREIIILLSPIGIEPLFFKGAGFLLSRLYRNMGDRVMEDIDILLPHNDIPDAVEKLKQQGYITHKPDQGEEVYIGHHHLPPMFHPGQVATIEIHRAPVYPACAAVISSAEVLEGRVRVSGEKELVPSLKHSQVLVFLHEHMVSRGYLSASGTLKGAYDFYLLAKLRHPETTDLPPGRFRKAYARYCYLAGRLMNNENRLASFETTALRCYWKREVIWINNPRVDMAWHDYVYGPVMFAGLLVSSLWSGTSGRLVVNKIRKRLGLKD